MTPKTYSVTTHPAGHGFHYLFPGKRKEEEGEGERSKGLGSFGSRVNNIIITILYTEPHED